MCYVSHVRWQLSHVMYHVSHVRWQLSHVMCHVSHVNHNFFFELKKYISGKKKLQSGGASWWRVCYQRGLPRRVYLRPALPKLCLLCKKLLKL